MSNYWLLITFTWFGSASLQYINTGVPVSDTLLESSDSNPHYVPLPYLNYFDMPSSQNDYETYQNDESSQFYHRDEVEPDLQRTKRTTEQKEEVRNKRWLPNLVDMDKTMYLKNDDSVASPFVAQGFPVAVSENNSDLTELQKRSFSPWGGKRDQGYEQTWTWKRAMNLREPSMPKRVRFSPWGGKRSGQMIYKPSNKDSRIIFSTSVPELTRIVSKLSPRNGHFDIAGFKLIPSLDKRNQIKVLTLSTRTGDGILREELPYNKFIEALPRVFKSGHPYSDVNLKKDGKRKVKFSAWGGKRSPPIIGPIWTPAPDDIKESTLDAILLIRNNANIPDKMTKTL